jgi:iron complex outermembrane recepter protein
MARHFNFLGGVSPIVLTLACAPALAQTVLPEIRVTASTPIVRRAPAPAPQAQPPLDLQGVLPIVADQFATITVIPREELQRTPGATLGDLLFTKPGITGSSFAPGAASRPIVRGLDNYRVRIQENGLATNDVSDLSEDHGVPIDPLGARQVEVIRGPATLRWGSQAIGGVVNVDNNRIPTSVPLRGFAFESLTAATSVDSGLEGAVSLDAGAGNIAVHADAYGRRAADYRIPTYPYLFPDPVDPPAVGGRQPNSAFRSNGYAVGGSYIFDNGFIGLSVSEFNSFYRIPGQEAAETNTRIDMRQTKVNGKGEVRFDGPVEAVRFWLGASNYQHDELANEGGFDGIHQTFTSRGQEGRVEMQLAPFDLRFATLTTAIGVQASRQELAAPGAEGGLFDPNDTRSVASYLFNEFRLSPTQRFQLAGRVERVAVEGSVPDLFVDPDLVIERRRNFTPMSAAAGFLQDLPFGLVASVTGQYVERAPRAPELLSRGLHEATGTFEIGNPDLGIESATSLEIGLRRATGPLRFEATAYHTRFKNFIFKRLTGVRCGEDFASCGVEDELAQVIYSQRDAVFRGAELQAQLDVAPLGSGMFGVDGQYDIVRATFTDGTAVPRIPPQRLGGGIYWRDPNWFLRVGLLHGFAQHRLAENETPTGDYNLLKAEIAYTMKLKPADFGPREIALGLTGTNLLDDDVRNHVSFKKDEVLMPGRSVRAFARVAF